MFVRLHPAMPGVRMKMKVSEHYKNGKPVGFKKFIAGRNFHLVTGTGPAEYQFAIRFATEFTAAAKSPLPNFATL
jgi:hypothetical protein